MFSTQVIHVELSSRCTLKCPRCPRTELHPDALNKEFKFDDFVTAFGSVLPDVKKFIFCGDIGDPIYCNDLIKIVEYIRKNSDAFITIVTNGSYRKYEWWVELGRHLHEGDTVTFSLDGWDQASNEQYRANCDWDSIIDGIKALKNHSTCRLRWSAIYFSFNQEALSSDLMLRKAKSLGFDEFAYVVSSKFDGRYSVNGVDPLKPNVAYSTTGQYVTTSTIIDRRAIPINTSIKPTAHEWAKCIKCEKEMFVNVEGLVFPCPWFNSGYQDNDFVSKYRNQLNIKTRSLKEVLADPMWHEFITRLEIAPLEVCRIKCRNG